MVLRQAQTQRAIQALTEFTQTPLDHWLPRVAPEHWQTSTGPADDARQAALQAHVLRFFRSVLREVPAYAQFVKEQGHSVEQVNTLSEFAQLPATTKQNYHQRFALAQLCRGGQLESCDMLAVSSGSTGQPSVWPRFVSDELATAQRFEQVFLDSFGADSRRTLAVVCFALGSWVGGMFTSACCRHLAMKGYPITLVTPGNQKAEILRVLRALAGDFEQVVLLGYPPFLKDVIDEGTAAGFDWKAHRVRLVMAGEVFSEQWRSLVCERLGATDTANATASLYGTADGGVLANETVLSVRIRQALAQRPELALQLFGEARLPTLCQYDPFHRYFEVQDGSLLFTGESGAPLVRYQILDRGGVIPFAQMLSFAQQHALDLGPPSELRFARNLPFVYVFGRSNFAVSYYGANVYPENVVIGLEQPDIAQFVTGKFVMQVQHDAEHNAQLQVTVELAAGALDTAAHRQAVEQSLRTHLERQNSEFLNYVPDQRRTPQVVLLPLAHPEYFPMGVKHRYTRS